MFDYTYKYSKHAEGPFECSVTHVGEGEFEPALRCVTRRRGGGSSPDLRKKSEPGEKRNFKKKRVKN